MLAQLQTGPIAVLKSLFTGSLPNLRGGNMGDLIQSPLHARYYEANYQKTLFNACTQAGQALSVAFATTYTGLCLSNPVGSTVNLVLTKVGIALSAAPAAIDPLGLMVGFNSATNVTHTTPATVNCGLIGSGASGQGKVDTAATLPTAPTLYKPLLGGFTAAALPSTTPVLVDLDGTVILTPGAYACIFGNTAATGIWSFDWEEVCA